MSPNFAFGRVEPYRLSFSLSDVFIGLNVIRALSIISLILVFSSSIMTLVEDVKAFNSFQNGPNHAAGVTSGNSTVSHDYVPYVHLDGPCASSLT